MSRALVVGLVLLLSSPAWAADKPKLTEETVIVQQENAPLAISSYKAEYKTRSKYRSEGIHHDVEFQNRSDRPVLAYRIGFVSFSAFNDFLGQLGGYAIETVMPQEDEKGSWVQRAYSGPSFHTGVAYVRNVRYEDGTIWEADMEDVLSELRKIEEDFDAARLEEEEGPGDDE